MIHIWNDRLEFYKSRLYSVFLRTRQPEGMLTFIALNLFLAHLFPVYELFITLQYLLHYNIKICLKKSIILIFASLYTNCYSRILTHNDANINRRNISLRRRFSSRHPHNKASEWCPKHARMIQALPGFFSTPVLK